MDTISYVNLSVINPDALSSLLNRQKIRQHLIDHAQFNESTVRAWVNQKLEVDTTQGCRVRAININNCLAGWCGIQLEDSKYEIAIVLDQAYWGNGLTVFRETMSWAKDLGHETIVIHFLHTRPEYKFLRKIAKNVYKSKLLGSEFTTYELLVNEFEVV